ncbi:MAG: VCBS repeat-containing protein [Planctomycetes bacterium]|nr:VCBS repeat-containing protein [Planctomycetota bacterium]
MLFDARMRLPWTLLLSLLSVVLASGGLCLAEDCNANGIPDAEDVTPVRELRAAGEYAVPAGACDLWAGDADGDGFLDLAVRVGDAEVCVLLNHGDGTFRSQPACFVPQELGLPCRGSDEVRADLDGDGLVDLAELDAESAVVRVLLLVRELPARSRDLNGNLVPDECEGPLFHRGDPSSDGELNITDAIQILGYLFLGSQAPLCLESADWDDDGSVDISDPIALLRYNFAGGPPPAPPGAPATGPCDVDPDPPGSPGDLGCAAYDGCGG